MPKRDRNHELETESQRAFEAAMPADLVVRPVADDYGIDREVEVFVDGRATGLTFKVQLKGTDGSGTKRRIKRDHLNYWNELDVPVLLVSYEAATGMLRGRWVHSINPDVPGGESKTLTVQMEPGILVDRTWAAKLADDLRIVRAIRRGDVPNRVPIRIQVDAGLMPKTQVTSALLNMTRACRYPMYVVDDLDEPALEIQISATEVRTALPLDMTTGRFVIEPGVFDHISPRAAAELVAIMASIMLAPVSPSHARHWLLQVPPECTWWQIDELLKCSAVILAHSETASHLLLTIIAVGDLNEYRADSATFAMMDVAADVDKDVFDSFSSRMRDLITTSSEGGRLAFNLANMRQARREFDAALELFNIANVRSHRYVEDALYHRARAACLWELGRYAESADVYREAIIFGSSPAELLPLLADSLMYAGEYAEARRILDAWKPCGKGRDEVGIIRKIVLSYLVDVIGIESQDRFSFKAPNEDFYREAYESRTLTDEDRLVMARAGDALLPFLWLELTFDASGVVEFEPLLLAAVPLVDMPAAWGLALMAAFENNVERSVLRAIVDQARFACGEEFHDVAWEAADQVESDVSSLIRDLVSEAYISDSADDQFCLEITPTRVLRTRVSDSDKA